MNLLALRKGAVKMLLSYKLLLMTWLTTMVMIFLVALPLRTVLKGLFKDSLSADRLIDGFDLGLVGDMGPAFGQLLSSATVGGLILLAAGFILHTFFAGGLFSKYTTGYGEFGISSFLKASSSHFFTNLGIVLVVSLMFVAWTVIVIALPAGLIISATKNPASLAGVRLILLSVWGFGLPVLFLIADHSRRWVSSTGVHKVFKALGEGFGSLRKKFLRSYLAIFIIFLVNVVFICITAWFTLWIVPEKGFAVFLFFVATQALFIVKLSLKAWRYATVTELALY